MHLLFALLLFTNTMNIQTEPVSGIHYILREPKIKSENPPVIILLHGVGSNEADLFSFADQLPSKYLIISARAPITLGEGSYAWYHLNFSNGKPVYDFGEEEKTRQTLLKFINAIKQKYSPKGDIYLCGFSQGAIMSYSVGLTNHDLIKGIAIMSGRLMEEIKPLVQSNEKLVSLRIFISHGTNDTTLPIQYARDANAYLKSRNVNAIYKEYTEGHGINSEMLQDLINWFN